MNEGCQANNNSNIFVFNNFKCSLAETDVQDRHWHKTKYLDFLLSGLCKMLYSVKRMSSNMLMTRFRPRPTEMTDLSATLKKKKTECVRNKEDSPMQN